ncbi:MAG: NAD(P)/FAD-dependent oxidoreductase [Nitrospira sp.]|nr:NAD(P)/FAD-dependent oxidoreductase [bacterium]MBL7049821.1 NAD(P)/FAD-dependent oxidoreductase [Nitrospira sp.]
MKKTGRLSKAQEHLLGMDIEITRRDFINAALIGTGALLLDLPSPAALFAETHEIDGYGGTGDYAVSHGNMDAQRQAAHSHFGNLDKAPENAIDTGEVYDFLIIGGGFSGLSAAFEIKNHYFRERSCLILDNHDITGGHAKRNEFEIGSYKLYGPQASNSFMALSRPSQPGYDIYNRLRLPSNFNYQEMEKGLNPLQFDKTNYGFMLWYDDPSIGHHIAPFVKKGSRSPDQMWLSDQWGKNFKDAPVPPQMKKDFVSWRTSQEQYYAKGDYLRWLDSITYKHYIENIMGLNPRVTKYADPVLASSVGLGCDAISAYAAYQVDMPGFRNFKVLQSLRESDWHSFPGGNDGIARHLVKALIPDAISGERTFPEIMNSRVNFDAMDRSENKTRIRLGSTAVWVEHDGQPKDSEYVMVYYQKDGKIYRVKAKKAIVTSGAYVASKIVSGLPQEHREAYGQFHRSPIMVVNVALNNWRFLYKLGLTACRWFGGFGFSCNIKQPMLVAENHPPLHPDYPAVLTFYIPFYYPGAPLKEQGSTGRAELLNTSYYDYEVRLRKQMVMLFGSAGFDPGRDIAGIIFNRWGHAYVSPQPGFYFGRDGKSAPRDIAKKDFGRISFANAEHNGHQNWVSAAEEGVRAAKQAMGVI